MPMPSANTPFSYPLPKGPSDFNGLPMGTYQAFPNIHPPQIPATPPSYESLMCSTLGLSFSYALVLHASHNPQPLVGMRSKIFISI
ncbi:IST1 factor associated with ESCRT-III [Homo sapiens]|uniref:IST1 factor associated with ESCRT-III n=1 Tax=Homo sapiens TaxID=9606 RepID=J3QQP8_HUMAN|nr:IST1 factor associated with ESCRT-III [Homo sapiens]